LKTAQAVQQQFADNPVGYQLEGLVYSQQENYPKRRPPCRRLTAKPPVPNRLWRWATAQWEGRIRKRRLNTLRQWLEKNPQDAGVGTQLGIYLELLNRQDEAIAQYEQILKQTPDNIIVLNNLAGLYGNRGDSRGVQYAEQALALAQKKPAWSRACRKSRIRWAGRWYRTSRCSGGWIFSKRPPCRRPRSPKSAIIWPSPITRRGKIRNPAGVGKNC